MTSFAFGKNKFYPALILILFFVLSGNLSASPMHHMDDANCATQTACNSCFVTASLEPPVLNNPLPFCYEFVETLNFYQSNILTPVSPPPKN